MTEMIRKQIYLEKRQIRIVRDKAKRLGINDSEVIRQAIDGNFYGNNSKPNYPDPLSWDRVEMFLSSQSRKTIEGKPYQFDREELYEERLAKIVK